MTTRTLASTNNFTSVAFTFTAHSGDGSLEDTLERFTTLMTALLAWIQLQLSIAGVASDVIDEMRVVLRQLSVALALLIEVLTVIVAVLHWLEDWYLAITDTWQCEVVGVFRWRPSYLPG